MEPITLTIIATIGGGFLSFVVSLVLKLLSDKFTFKNPTIKIGNSEIQFDESPSETLRKISEEVYRLQDSPHVFISYSFQDEFFVQRLSQDLRNQGVVIWLATEQIRVGEFITEKLLEGIKDSQWIIAIISENYNKSPYATKELSFALEEEKKRNHPFVLPVLIDNSELPLEFKDRQFADFSHDYYIGLEKLLHAIKPSDKFLRSNILEAQQLFLFQKWLKKQDEISFRELIELSNSKDGLMPSVLLQIKNEYKKLQDKEKQSSGILEEKDTKIKEMLHYLISASM
jgi:hypothetical protein